MSEPKTGEVPVTDPVPAISVPMGLGRSATLSTAARSPLLVALEAQAAEEQAADPSVSQ